MTVAVFNHKVVDIGIGVRFADIFVLILKQRVYDENIVEQSDSRAYRHIAVFKNREYAFSKIELFKLLGQILTVANHIIKFVADNTVNNVVDVHFDSDFICLFDIVFHIPFTSFLFRFTH